MTFVKYFSLAVFCIAAVPFGAGPLSAQSEDASDEQTEALKELAEQQALVQAQLDLLNVQSKLRDAQVLEDEKRVAQNLVGLPDPAKGLEGTIDLSEGSTAFGRMLTYNALNQIAKDVAYNVCKTAPNKTVTLVDSEKLSNLASMASVARLQMDELSSNLNIAIATIDDPEGFIASLTENLNITDEEDVGTESAVLGTILQGIPAIAGGVAEITKLFRSDTTLSALKVEVSDHSLELAVASARSQMPDCTSNFEFTDRQLSGENEIATQLRGVSELAGVLQQRIGVTLIGIEREKLRQTAKAKAERAAAKALFDLAAKRPGKSMTSTERSSYNHSIKAAEQGDAKNALLDFVGKRLEASGKTISANISKLSSDLASTSGDRRSVLAQMNALPALDEDRLYLDVSVVASDAQSVLIENTFRSNRLSYSGSVAIEYLLFNEDGRALDAGVFMATKTKRAKLKNGFSALE